MIATEFTNTVARNAAFLAQFIRRHQGNLRTARAEALAYADREQYEYGRIWWSWIAASLAYEIAAEIRRDQNRKDVV